MSSYPYPEIRKFFYKILVLVCSSALVYAFDYFNDNRYFFAKPTDIEQKVYRVKPVDFGGEKISGEGLAIVVSGGGMRSAYSAGSLLALVDRFGLTDPDIVIGSSGGVGNLAYYVSGQYDSIENIWFNFLANPRFVSFFRFNQILDVDYLIDDIMKKQDPLDIERIKNSKIKFFISATDFYTGQEKYFSNNDNLFEAMRASKAIPIVFNEKVDIDGAKYIDGEISSPVRKNIEKAKYEGAKKIIVIDVSDKNPFMTSFILKLYSLSVSDELSKVVSGYYFSDFEKDHLYYKDDVLILNIKPSKNIPAFILENNGSRVRESFFLGYNDVLNNKELEKFLMSAR